MLDTKVLVNRHGKAIDAMVATLNEGRSKKVTLDKGKKETLAVLCENFSVQARKQAGTRRLNEGTGLSDIGPYQKFGINLISATMSIMTADQFVSVQPMTNRIGEVRYLKYVYGSNKGTAKKGDLVSSALEFAATEMEYSLDEVSEQPLGVVTGATKKFNLGWTPIKPGTAVIKVDGKSMKDKGDGTLENVDAVNFTSGKINYETGEVEITFSAATQYDTNNFSADFGYITTNVGPQVPEIDAQVDVMPIKAQSRKLKTAYSFDAAFDMQGDYGFDMDAETLSYFSAEIAHEIDGEIYEDLRKLAVSHTDKITEWDPKAPTGVSQADHDDAFWNRIVEGGNLIFKRIRKGRASFIVAGIEACNTIETMRQFKPANIEDATGPHIVGTVKGIPVVKNPYYPDKQYVVGYKGASVFDAGYVYAPYMPVSVIDQVKEDGFTLGKGFVTAYGKVPVNPKCYALGTIK